MKRIAWTIAAAALVMTASAHLGWLTRPAGAQTAREAPWGARTPWGDPDLQGEWTSEGEYGVPFERPADFGSRQFLTDEEYARRIEDVRIRDERDLVRVDVLAGRVDGPNAPIPHWREYNTTSRRTSLIIDPPDGRLPPRTPQARPVPVQRCGSLQRGEPCDSYEDYNLGVRCIVHGGGFPDAMFPAVYNANMRILQSPGLVAISYELIHDTRIITLDASAQPAPFLSSGVRRTWAPPADGGTARRWSSNPGPSDRHARGHAGPAPDRAVHPNRARRHPVPGHLHRSGDVDRAVDGGARPQGTAGECRRVRVRLPRREPRDAQHALHGALPRADGWRTRTAPAVTGAEVTRRPVTSGRALESSARGRWRRKVRGDPVVQRELHAEAGVLLEDVRPHLLARPWIGATFTSQSAMYFFMKSIARMSRVAPGPSWPGMTISGLSAAIWSMVFNQFSRAAGARHAEVDMVEDDVPGDDGLQRRHVHEAVAGAVRPLHAAGDGERLALQRQHRRRSTPPAAPARARECCCRRPGTRTSGVPASRSSPR